MVSSQRLPLLSRNGGFSESTEQKWKHRVRYPNQDMAFCLLGERQTALEKNRHLESVSHEGISMAGSKAVARCSRKPNASQHQRSTNRQHAGRAVQSREDADTLQHAQIV